MTMLLTADDIAARLKLSRAKVYTMLASGELPVVRIGKAVRVAEPQFEAWLANKLRRPAVPMEQYTPAEVNEVLTAFRYGRKRERR